MSNRDARSVFRFLYFPVAVILLAGIGTVLIRIAGFPAHTTAAFRNAGQSWLEAAFTAVSAVTCVGLTLRDPAELTPLGQTVVFLLAQVGALLYMLAGSLALARFMLGRPPRVRPIVIGVLLLTLLPQVIATLAIFFPAHGLKGTPHDLARAAVDALSAGTHFGPRLMPAGAGSATSYSLTTHLVLLPLMLIGALGLPVVMDLIGSALNRSAPGGAPAPVPGSVPGYLARLHPLTRSMLRTACLVYVVGTLALLAVFALPTIYQSLGLNIEMSANLRPTGGGITAHVLADAGYLSINSHSAGLSGYGMESISPAGLLVLIVLMFTGGFPGGAAGGAGFLALTIALAACFRADHPQALLRYALTTFAGLIGLTLLTALVLSASDPAPPGLRVFFESASAVTGSGLSVGVTENLSTVGRGVVLAAMLLGRLWPILTLQRLAA